MNYYILGKLSKTVIDEFKEEILKNKKPDINYQWIHFNSILEQMFLSIFHTLPMDIQINPEKNQKVQKVFFSNPGYGFRIHRDGLKCKSALNIAVSSNETDWVRWYSDELINSLENSDNIKYKKKWGLSRDTNIFNYEDIPYEDELKVTSGDVYILNVDKFHSFKCNGPEPRIIIQTKFENFPDLAELYKKITPSLFKNLTTL